MQLLRFGIILVTTAQAYILTHWQIIVSFVLAANAVNAILSVPQTKKAPPLDYLAKEDYGKVPAYLSHIKNEIQAETAMIDEFVREQMGLNNIAPVIRHLSAVANSVSDSCALGWACCHFSKWLLAGMRV
jgi:hypothetical protein